MKGSNLRLGRGLLGGRLDGLERGGGEREDDEKVDWCGGIVELFAMIVAMIMVNYCRRPSYCCDVVVMLL